MSGRHARARLITTVLFPALWMLGHTWRVIRVGTRNHEQLVESDQAIAWAFPHGRLVPAAFLHRWEGVHILISSHADGEIAARVSRMLGYGTVRGSSTRGGTQSLREMCRMAPQVQIGIPVDGPKGPEGQAKQGIVQLARLSRRKIVPVGIAASRFWRLRSWDRMLIPKPFARVVIAYGEPIEVPRELAKDEVDQWRQAVDRALHAVDDEAWRLVENHDPGVRLPSIS